MVKFTDRRPRNYRIQATPSCAFLSAVAQLSGAPDPERSA
jgi:hypothetical protein